MHPVSHYKSGFWSLKLKCLLVFLLILTTKSILTGQKPDISESTYKGDSYENTFSTSRVGIGQSVMITPQGEFHVVVQHRFSEINSSANEFFGLDYASTRLGFEYGISDWLSAGIGRSMAFKTYDLELKALLLKQAVNKSPFSLAYYFSILDNTSQFVNDFPAGHNSFGSRQSFVNQILFTRNQSRFAFQMSPFWVHSNYDANVNGSLNLFAVDLDGRIKLNEIFGIVAEYIPIITRESFSSTNPFTVGLDINTGGHQFQLVLSNSQGTNEKAILTNTAGSWAEGKIYFGFNLTRVFHSKKD
jgi:hypothetical protein